MDIVAKFPGPLTQFRVDVTIRSPFAQSLKGADSVAARAASIAESTKERRYGQSVLPIAFESCGCLGYKSGEALQSLRQEALLWGWDALGTTKRFSHWQRELETVVADQIADTAIHCMGRSGHRCAAVGDRSSCPRPRWAGQSPPTAYSPATLLAHGAWRCWSSPGTPPRSGQARLVGPRAATRHLAICHARGRGDRGGLHDDRAGTHPGGSARSRVQAIRHGRRVFLFCSRSRRSRGAGFDRYPV